MVATHVHNNGCGPNIVVQPLTLYPSEILTTHMYMQHSYNAECTISGGTFIHATVVKGMQLQPQVYSSRGVCLVETELNEYQWFQRVAQMVCSATPLICPSAWSPKYLNCITRKCLHTAGKLPSALMTSQDTQPSQRLPLTRPQLRSVVSLHLLHVAGKQD